MKYNQFTVVFVVPVGNNSLKQNTAVHIQKLNWVMLGRLFGYNRHLLGYHYNNRAVRLHGNFDRCYRKLNERK